MKRIMGIVLVSLVPAIAGEAFAQGGTTAESPPPPPPAAETPAAAALPSGDDKAKEKKEKTAEEKFDDATKQLVAASKKLEDAAAKLGSKSDESKPKFDFRLPWNGIGLKLGEKENKATVGLSWSFRQGRGTFRSDLTVPLDEDTRRAALLNDEGQVSPFQLKLALDFNSVNNTLRRLLHEPEKQKQRMLCDRYIHATKREGKMCPLVNDKDYDAWVKDNPEFEKEIDEKIEAENRPPAIDGIFSRRIPYHVSYTLGIELNGSFDRQKVYGSDIAAKADPRNKWSFSTSAVARFYPGKYVTIPIRGGVKVEDGSKVNEFERCSSLASTDTSITGELCKKALVLDKDKGTQTTGYAEAGIVVVPNPPLSWDFAPGVDLRARIDGLGGTKIGHLFATLLLLPTDQPITSRFGIGVDIVRAFDDESGTSPSFHKGDVWLVPFIQAGGSL